ncbi:MAG TPA: type II toxin-antitoxin system Phd/YefM family antitoxin [Chloroflexi bacterium]|nr:type II toxin-antitoxin system Phd/YefM family antitoxin [Chloroflexota bacterium]
MEKVINAVAARRRLGQLLEEAFYRGDVFIIERAGRPMAAVIPIEQYRQWQQRREEFFAMIDEVQERTRKVPPEELEEAIAEAVAAAKAVEEKELEPSL